MSEPLNLQQIRASVQEKLHRIGELKNKAEMSNAEELCRLVIAEADNIEEQFDKKNSNDDENLVLVQLIL